MWLKNTDGKPDAMLTFATVAFLAVTLNILFATVGTISYGENSIDFQTLDSGTMGVYLAATFTAYVSRRLTDRHYTSGSEPEVDSESENE